MLEGFLKICGAISVTAAALVVLYKGFRSLIPIKASISYSINFDGSKRDSLSVIVTNCSTSSLYLRSCSVRCTYSRLRLARMHLRKPLLAPRLYPNLRFNGVVYQLMGKDPIKLEPGQLIELRTEIYEHPLNALYGPMLIALVELTNGRAIRSRRIPSPPVWRTIGRRNRAPS